MSQKYNINTFIRASELRVVDEDNHNLGVLSLKEALLLAKERSLDLIEINATSNPPIAKIADFGKFSYDQSKKEKKVKENAHKTETKVIQIMSGTGENDLLIKAKAASKWLKEGHRVKIDLRFKDRTRYMGEEFMKERVDRLLRFITEDFKISEPYKKAPRAYSVTIERSKSKIKV